MTDGPARRSIVEAGYDQVVDRYAELEAPDREWPRMRWLSKLLEHVDPGAAVLDVGCGNGVPATRAIAQRFDATGIDISAAQIERARQNVPGARLLHQDLLDADFGEEFDAIAAFYVVDHVEREQHASIFECFHRWLRPSGWLLFTIEPDDEPGAIREWLGKPMFFSQHDADTTLALVRAAGFEIVEASGGDAVRGRTRGSLSVGSRAEGRPLARCPPEEQPRGVTFECRRGQARVHVEFLPPSEPLDDHFDAALVRRRAIQVIGLLVVVGLVAWLAPGLGEVRSRLQGAQPGWLVLAVALEVLSCLSYVLMFAPAFCRRMSWRTSYELGMSELAVGSLVPASGAGGLALGAWALRKDGMAAEDIARRSVAFFALKSAANFVAVAVVGVLMFAGVGPAFSPLLTILPAALAIVAIAGVACVPLATSRAAKVGDRGGRWNTIAKVLLALDGGIREAGRILRRHDWKVIAGSLGYWAFDNAVLWACFRAFGESPALTVVLMGYLIGQLGGLLPLPGGLGGIDGGLIGVLVVYGVPVAAVVAAVLAYRLVLFWLPLLVGSLAFIMLRRGLGDPDRPDLCGAPRSPPLPARP